MKASKSSKTLAVVAVGVVSVAWLSARSQSVQTQPVNPKPPTLQDVLTKNSGRPPVGELEGAAVEPAEARKERQKREISGRGFYNRGITDPGTKEVNGQEETLMLSLVNEVRVLEPGERPDPPGLPVSSSTIVIGNVMNGKTFVSEDRTYVYADYRIKVNQVLKSDPGNPVSVGDQITVSRTGGSIRFPSGHIKHYIIAGRGFPEIGAEHLFFLRRIDSESTAFTISTAFGLKEGFTRPIDDGQAMKQFEGKKATDFLSDVSNAIAVAAQAGGDQR